MRARSSAAIVHNNFAELAEMCSDIASTGLIEAEAGSNSTDIENEVYRRVHNYLASFYSYDEQIREILNRRQKQHIGKRKFLPDRNNHAAPRYSKRGAFLWGLRNDFQHGDYWCLSVKKVQEGSDYDCYHMKFDKTNFDATPKGGIDDSSGYIAHAPDREYEYPLTYIADFHQRLFNDFETAFEDWYNRR